MLKSKKITALILIIFITVSMISIPARKVYAEVENIRIVISENSVYAGSDVSLKAEVNGAASTDVTWSVSGNMHADTRIDVVSTPHGSYNVLIVSIYENAEEIVLRATSNEDPSKYDELTLTVIPPEYISELRLTNGTFAACVDASMTAIDAIRNFNASLRIEDPENSVNAFVDCSLFRVPEGYDEVIPDYRQFDWVDYGTYLEKDSEYYFVLSFQIKLHYYYDPNGFKVIYNGRESDHWGYGPDESADGFLKVYIKAQMTEYNGSVRVIPYGIDFSDFDLDGDVITTACEAPVRAGYLSEDGYVALNAESGSDGSHSFKVPEGADNVVLVVKGDATGDGTANLGDAARIKAAFRRKLSLNAVELFAADVNGDGSVNLGDAAQVTAAFRKKYTIGW